MPKKKSKQKSKRQIEPKKLTRRKFGTPAASTTNLRATKKKRLRQKSSPGVTKAIAKMRKSGISLNKAAREVKVSPRTVIKKAKSALRKKSTGRYAAKTSDRLVRSLMIPTSQGPVEINVRGLGEASRLGKYWVSVHRYYETGETSGLQKFRGQSITSVDGVKHPLLADLDMLNVLGSAGVLSFESMYGRSE